MYIHASSCNEEPDATNDTPTPRLCVIPCSNERAPAAAAHSSFGMNFREISRNGLSAHSDLFDFAIANRTTPRKGQLTNLLGARLGGPLMKFPCLALNHPISEPRVAPRHSPISSFKRFAKGLAAVSKSPQGSFLSVKFYLRRKIQKVEACRSFLSCTSRCRCD